MYQERGSRENFEEVTRDTLMIFEDALMPSYPTDEEQKIMRQTGFRVLKIDNVYSDPAARGLPKDRIDKLSKKLENNIGQADITDEFSSFILDTFREQAGSAVLKFAGPGVLKGYCGLDPDEGRFGIFDPDTAEETEREALEVFSSLLFIIPDLAQEHSEKLSRWREALEKKYKRD